MPETVFPQFPSLITW